MDVHLRSTTVCALDAETGEAVTRRFRGNPWGEVAEWMSGFPGPSLAAYESGYLGFAPQRELSGLGVDCVVAAVSRVPRSSADLSSKNDRNDAARMVKAILSHDVTPVWVPSPEIEGLRDLAAAHDAATARLAAAKQRLLAFLARRGYAYGGTTPAGNPRRYWTYDFLRWLDKVRPADDGGIRALAALRSEVEAAAETRDDLLAEYRAAVAAGPLSAEVEALQSIKGCGFALAAAFASEVGDFSRFRSGRQVTSYFGLAPKQRSSADSVRLGGISGAGNALVRRLAVEGSWSYVQAEPPTEADAQGQRRPARGEDAREEGFRAPAPAPRGDARQGHAPGEGERRHRRRAREVAVGPRRDVPGGNRIDIAPVPASRAAFGDTPAFAGRAAVGRMRVVRLGEPRRRRGLRAAGAVSADMRLSRRRRRHAGGEPGRVQRQAPPTDCKRSAGPLWLLTADWVI